MERRHFLKSLVATLTVTATPGGWAGTPKTGAAGTPAPLTTVQIPPGQFVTLCMHDVRDDVAPGVDNDPYAMNTRRLAALFDWMKVHDWHPVSLQRIVDAHAGKTDLPKNAVLLSWDDGLASIYSRVFPLLKAFQYPGLFALETDWLTRVHRGLSVDYQGEGFAASVTDTQKATDALKIDEAQARASNNLKAPNRVLYNGSERGAKGFISWAQAREMQASGLVEFATHTHDLHHGILANPQGNVEPAAITRQYLAPLKRYETDREFHTRILTDLRQSAAIIQREIGVRPRAIVWPYGAMNAEVEAIAREAGLPISFGLGDRRLDSRTQALSSFGRLLVMDDPTPVSIEAQVSQSITPVPGIERAVQVDMDYIYDPDPVRTNSNLGKLLDRIKALKVRTVYLQAFADPDGSGNPKALYFPNRVLPMRADLFNRVTWQLRTRAGVRVFAWLPLLAYQLPDTAQQDRLSVKIQDAEGKIVPARRDYHRLSPFLPETLALVGDIYADLGKSMTGISGLLIHDDAYLAEDEDATALSPEARWPGTDRPVGQTPLTARQKTEALIAFGEAVAERMRYYTNASNPFIVARNLYARVVLDPEAESRFAQALDPFLAAYDGVALMAMPYLDGTTEPPERWLRQLAETVARTPTGLQKVVFELQTKNWTTGAWIPGATLKNWMQELTRMGAVNLAYYPDDFLTDHPPFTPTFEGISLTEFPYYRLKH
ncbi:poly-beta-1,6-N-acetyl-D-glucosamine N-deacetylase PgaB [Halothiobacillus diazotrophicus]|uniref:poly-beta-1,6-N-acetyl-D-glucosamine N-deacetylase PgaB n=1 Tax=Halothiobacillus diazotrophicus TaxID=1860122 RepID=UPI0009EE144B|nr:poly-beta-1,6-N-acetyl-D-glucosamine N-deacetylase PgaB [Halothiobacillus diazotrophicus]